MYAAQAAQDGSHAVAKAIANLVDRFKTTEDVGIQEDGKYAIALEPYLGRGQTGCLQGHQNGVQTEYIALQLMAAYGLQYVAAYELLVARCERVGYVILNRCVELYCCSLFFGGEV